MLSRRAMVGMGLAAALPWPDGAAARPARSDFVLGAQSHFDQGWRLPWMDLARRIGADHLRDALSWPRIETRRGEYDFDPYRTDFLIKARRDGVRLLMVLEPRHPAYDDGNTVFSATGQRAFADYLAALFERYGDVISAVEIGNEINGQGGMTGPAASRRAETHVALLAAIRSRVKPDYPSIPILGGSTNVIGVGFLERIFEAGGLEVMDGVSVHPYRSYAEHVDVELAALEAAMRRHGQPVPVYAPEFGGEVDRPEDACPLMLKMVAMMGTAGVQQACWYVLCDEQWFRNMGLYTQRQALKPAGETFAFIQRSLMPGGRPERAPTDDLSYVYRFGTAGVVFWGAPRPMRIVGSGQAYDARGGAITMPDLLSEAPVVVLGDVRVELGDIPIVADSFHQFGRAPWSYFAETPDGELRPLGWIHWDWTSYIGDRRLQPLAFNPRGLVPATRSGRALRSVLRYTAPRSGRVVYDATLSRSGSGSDGVNIALRRGGETFHTEVLTSAARSLVHRLDLAAGETVDLSVGPNRTAAGNALQYRVTVSRDADSG